MLRISDLNQALDAAPLSGLSIVVIACTSLVLVLDGMDIQAISLVAPLLAREFSVTTTSLGPVFAAALIGMAIGGFLLGFLGDRHGRRPMLLLSVFVFGAATLACAAAHSISVLLLYRLCTGIGLGGAVPNALALMAELTPARWRTMAVSSAVLGVPVGGMLGASIASAVLPIWGWKAMFVIGGALPIVTASVIYFLLPESPSFLALRPVRQDDLGHLLHRLTGKRPGSGTAISLELPPDARLPAVHLFSRSLLRDTIGLWLVFATNMFVIYTFFSWSPVILDSLGLPLLESVRGSMVFNVAGLVGGAFVAFVAARAGTRWPASAMALIGAGSLAFLGLMLSKVPATQSVDTRVLMAAIAFAGFSMIGVQTAAYRLSTQLYPTQIRASGVGWAAGLGRLGGILSSLTAGRLLKEFLAAGLFEILAGLVLFTFVGLLLIKAHMIKDVCEVH